jgi:hypothetical protein
MSIARVDLFCEDAAHESFSRALVQRVAREEGVEVTIRVVSARFGIPRLERELRAFGRLLAGSSGLPDLLVMMVDGNSEGPAARRARVESVIDLAAFPHHAIGTPDPCVERWFLADPVSFAELFGPVRPVESQDGDGWKTALVGSLSDAGEIVTGGGAEFADDVVDAMDLYRAGREAQTLRRFTQDVRLALRQVSGIVG